ncbi:hypothetical protein [Thalassoroseus pseudoceratinae]|uniref:hypothetical protein n=1 Tax=Thalassoroseus pseudoceratinae TaxID=2713176 RepID=UPI00141DA009|nr:hypothetical protein [Thalassoroseus pseudoceratinae]
MDTEQVTPEPESKLTCITSNVPNDNMPTLGTFEESCRRYGQPVLNSLQGKTKYLSIHKLTTAAKLVDRVGTEFVLISDSADSVFVRSPRQLLADYQRHFTAEAVFIAVGDGGENRHRAFERYVPGAWRYERRSPGSGTFIGRTTFLRQFLNRAVELIERGKTDMHPIRLAWQEFYPKAVVDYESILFRVVRNWEQISFQIGQ